MAGPQELPDIQYDAPVQVAVYWTTVSRVSSGRLSQYVIASTVPGDPSATRTPFVFYRASMDPAHLELVSAFSLQHPRDSVVLDLDLTLSGLSDVTELSSENLNLISTLVSPCDYVVVRTPFPFDPYFWKTDGGIPPGKLLLPWQGPTSLHLCKQHGLAGFATSDPLQSAEIRAFRTQCAFRLDATVLDRRRDRFRRDYGGGAVEPGGVGVDPHGDDGGALRRASRAGGVAKRWARFAHPDRLARRVGGAGRGVGGGARRAGKSLHGVVVC